MPKTPLTLVYFTRPQACPQCRAWEAAGLTVDALAEATNLPRVLMIDPGRPATAEQMQMIHLIDPRSVPALFLWDGHRAVHIAPRSSLEMVPSLQAVADVIREERMRWQS